jgi:hypothetical protein
MITMHTSTVTSPVRDIRCLAARHQACLRSSQVVAEHMRSACSVAHVFDAGHALGSGNISADGEPALDVLLCAGSLARSVGQKGVLRQDERFALAGFASDAAGRVASGSSYLHIGQGVETRQQRAGRDMLPCRYSRQGFSPRKSQRRRSRQAARVHFGQVEAAGASSGRPGRRQADARQVCPAA